MIMASDPGGTYGFPSRRAAQNKPERHAAVPEEVRSSGGPPFCSFPPYVKIGTEGSAVDENDRREFEKVVSVYKTLKVNADLNEIAKE